MSLKQLEILSQQKYLIQKENFPDWCNAHKYIEELWKEIEEVKVEIKDNNNVHLEDELGDLFWDLLWLIESLRQDKMVDSLESIIAWATKKYSERVEVCDTQWGRDKVKKIQKEELKKHHHLRYWDINL